MIDYYTRKLTVWTEHRMLTLLLVAAICAFDLDIRTCIVV